MKRRILVLAILPVLVFALTGVAQAWQGRMGGMNDPYGLVQDESDFLIHPAKLAKEEGIRFYGYYQFTYTDLIERDFDILYVGALSWTEMWDLSGDEYGHDGLVGAAFPLGPGRMGLFFEYSGKRGDYDGTFYSSFLPPEPATDYELTQAFDDFSGRFLYALPAGGVNLGFEAQVAYRQEEKESYFSYPPDPYFYALNPSYGGFLSYEGFPDYLPFVDFFPYDSSYWEVLLKGSAEFAIGPADLEFALRYGFLFGGDHEWKTVYYHAVYADHWPENMEGDVGGWQIGGDLWVRVPVASGLTLPFLVRVDYQEKDKDGEYSAPEDGIGPPGWYTSNHEITEKSLDLMAGGGVDMELGTGTRIAGGIYYNYLQDKNRRTYASYDNNILLQYNTDFGNDLTEHRVLVRFAGEHELSPLFTLRAGFSAFYGWTKVKFPLYIEEDIQFFIPLQFVSDVGYTADGSHWGIGGSLGGTVSLNGFALEPFVKGGWHQFIRDGDGMWSYYINGTQVTSSLSQGDLDYSEWYISGGCALLFDLP